MAACCENEYGDDQNILTIPALSGPVLRISGRETEMAYDFVFVHGTGVREPAYTTAFNRISEELKSRRNGVRMHRCYWGADYGTRLHKDGASILGFETKRDPTALPNDEEYTVGLWSLLYQDPLLETSLPRLKRGKRSSYRARCDQGRNSIRLSGRLCRPGLCCLCGASAINCW